jgi:hypothetical protein
MRSLYASYGTLGNIPAMKSPVAAVHAIRPPCNCVLSPAKQHWMPVDANQTKPQTKPPYLLFSKEIAQVAVEELLCVSVNAESLEQRSPPNSSAFSLLLLFASISIFFYFIQFHWLLCRSNAPHRCLLLQVYSLLPLGNTVGTSIILYRI